MRVELQQVSVRHGEREVLGGIDLVLPSGSVTAVVGPSGAGLTTLLKVAVGLLAPDGGRVLHDGQDLAALAGEAGRRHQTRSGFMFQDAALWANQTLRANLELPLLASDPALTAVARQERIAGLLAGCGWSVPLDRRPVDLSRGERLVMSFLRAVVAGPDLLCLDEPFAALDDHWRAVLVARVEQENARGATVLLTGQDAGAVAGLTSRAVALEAGEVVP